MVLCVFVAVVSMSRYDTSTILLRSLFLNIRQHCTRDCVVLLCVGGACRQSTLTGVGIAYRQAENIRVSGPLCDNFIYYV